MSKCIEAFKAFYNTKTSNRKLRWMHGHGVVTVCGNFNKHKIDLMVSDVQAAILLLFNEFEELSIEEMIKHTKLTPDNMKQQLRSLASGKYKILVKSPADGYKPNHMIKPNKAFTSQQRRIRLPTAATKVTTKERKVAQSAVTEDRRHAIEASIVRIMKSRKTLTHQQLVAEVSQQLMHFFQPDPRQIKKRIEDLIARDYLERDQQQINVYHYLA
jgi:cullin 1